MTALADLLTPGERVIWSGSPDWPAAKIPAPFWRRKLVHAAWTVGFAGLAVGLTFAGHEPGISGFFRNALGFAVVLIAAGVFFSTLAFFDFKEHPKRKNCDQEYAITDLRILSYDVSGDNRTSITGRNVSHLHVTLNGGVANLTIAYGWGEDDFIVFQAINDVTEVEKIIIQHFASGKDQHEQARSAV